MTIPQRTSVREAEAFAKKQENWIRRKLEALPEPQLLSEATTVTLRGKKIPIKTASSSGPCRLSEGAVWVGGSREQRCKRLVAFLKDQARRDLVAASDYYSGELGRNYAKISIRDTRSRWGSCSAQGNLMYSWRLIMTPPEVLRYVAAHEVAHLIEMNHSDRFWDIVYDLMPDFETHRTWLRQNGPTLHRLDVGA